ncbi:MAG: hypothetical protein K0U86_01925 [Planctomycetes bacterium]|nr:hypothetical protein [Planctomycetota bacterium]MCH9723645.1 hypothetical protein [Planctomycetota bacterium]MCH9778463.1 hypothetical protein [Planctomycetota bacterium]MCH9791454.1 hypothetical protein [Planctomycetota bacterium]
MGVTEACLAPITDALDLHFISRVDPCGRRFIRFTHSSGAARKIQRYQYKRSNEPVFHDLWPPNVGVRL